MRLRTAIILGVTLVGVIVGALVVVVPRLMTPTPAATAEPPASSLPPPSVDLEVRKIKARLLYVAPDGAHLTAVEQDVPYSRESQEQARAIITAQLAAPPPGLTSAIPAGTRLRAIYLAQSQAFVDVSAELMSGHPGGLNNEMLTAYSLVHALMLNLPAVTAVQILIDGKEVDTLAGHLDLRRPLEMRPQLTLTPSAR